MTVEAQDDKGLSIYWDYDAAQIDLNAVSGYEIVRKIRSAVNIFGVIQSFKMYHDSSNQSLSTLRSELWSSGVTLVGCPSKKAATKMMIVDIIAYAWDHPAPRAIVIISGDKDLAYMIGTLRMRKYEVILISPNGTHASITNQASVNLDWTVDGRRTNMDDPHGGKFSSHPPSPHPPPSPHGFPSPSFSSLPFPAMSGVHSHYSTSNFLAKPQEIHPPMVELQGMPTTRGRHPYEPDKFDVFGASGGTFPSPSASNGMFGLGDGRSQLRGPARQVRSDSAPPGIHSTHSSASSPDSNGFGRMTSSAKGKQREFPMIEPEDIGPQSPLNPEIPEEPRATEGLFTSMHPSSAKISITPLTTGVSTRSSSQDSLFSVIQFPPSSTLTSVEPINIDSDNTTERGKSPAPILVAPQEFPFVPPKTPVGCETEKVSTPTPSPRKEETISAKPSPRASLPIQSQVPDPFQDFPTPLPPSQEVSNKTLDAQARSNSTVIAQAGPSSVPSHKHVPPRFQVLVDTLREHGGSYPKSTLSTQLVTRDPGVYQKAQVAKCKQYIKAAMKAGLVREVNAVNGGLCIFLTEVYA